MFYSEHKKELAIVLGAVLLIGAVYLAFPPDTSRTTSDVPPEGPIAVRGTMECLPHRDTSGPQTLECAIGLLDEQGRHFALRDTDPEYKNISGGYSTDMVIVEGTFDPGEDSKYASIGVIHVTSIAGSMEGWKTFTDTQNGISFEYPDSLGTKYIHPVNWPPAVEVTSGIFSCAVSVRSINGNDYCITSTVEGAAGSTYTSYTYIRNQEAKNVNISLEFSLRSVQCANYNEPEQSTCETERQTFSTDTLAHQIMQTMQTRN